MVPRGKVQRKRWVMGENHMYYLLGRTSRPHSQHRWYPFHKRVAVVTWFGYYHGSARSTVIRAKALCVKRSRWRSVYRGLCWNQSADLTSWYTHKMSGLDALCLKHYCQEKTAIVRFRPRADINLWEKKQDPTFYREDKSSLLSPFFKLFPYNYCHLTIQDLSRR